MSKKLTVKKIEDDEENSERQAKAKLDSILEMVQGLDSEEDRERESALQTITEDALSIEVRADWHTLDSTDNKPKEYNILLCTGGPAVRIKGELNEYQEPVTAILEHQNWFTPWIEYNTTQDEEEAMLRYARVFYFGD